MKTGIRNKNVCFVAECVAPSFRNFRPEGLNGYGIEMAQPTSLVREKPVQNGEKKNAPRPKKAAKTSGKRVVKIKAQAGKKTTQGKKPPVLKKIHTQKTSQAALGVQIVTGRDIAQLRTKFGMTQVQFAQLLGISAASVRNWEKKNRMLKLQSRTLKTYVYIKEMTKRQALNRLKDL